MTIHIDQLTSDVTPEPEPSAPAAGTSGDPWDELDRARQSHSRLIRDMRRTSSEGFDD